MPIRLITGLPGHGKTLLMVSQIMEQAEKADRPMYEAGVDGLSQGVCTPLLDAREWNAIDPDVAGDCTCGKRPPHAHVIPDGSIIYVDEAWKWFGHMYDARGQKAPDAVLELAEHRHRGIDFVWTTQGPGQLYPFARTLIADHTHVVRRFGTSICSLYSWGELNEDVKSQSMRANAVTRQWGFPRAMFDKYKSATQHTIKRKLPFRLFLIPGCIVGALFLALYAYHKLTPEAAAARGGVPMAATGSPVPPSGDSQAGHPKYTTPLSYVVAHTPRIASQPWSAPVYDGRHVTADPKIYCMITAQDKKNSSCHCYTEQATPYQARLDDSQCRNIALWGNYDPYQVEQRREESRDSQTTNTPHRLDETRTPAQATGQGASFAQQPHYGQIHTESAANDKGYDSHAFQ